MGFKEKNEKERMKFVDLWSEYVRTHDDIVWSRQQNMIINAALRSASISRKDYLKLKGEKSDY